MMIDALFVDEWVILATTAPMYRVTARMNLATLHKTVPTRFSDQEHHATKTDLIHSIDILLWTWKTWTLECPYLGASLEFGCVLIVENLHACTDCQNM